jgi:CHAT domain-containing protein
MTYECPTSPARWAAVFSLAALSALAACQTGGPPALSVEEAKQVTTTFEDRSFVPPPRTINDITAILDQQKLSDPRKTEQHEADADAEPPEGNNPKVLLRFYMKRGMAARKIGRSTQALEDLRKALRLSKKGRLNTKQRNRLLVNLATVESTNGFPLNAIRIMERAIQGRAAPAAYRKLLQLYARSGNLKGVGAVYDRGRGLIAQFSSGRRRGNLNAEKLALESVLLDHRYHESQGKKRDAEQALRRAIGIFQSGSFKDEAVSWLPSHKRMLASNLRRQGRLVEAEVIAREGLLEALKNIGRDNATTADGAAQLASILREQGRYADAEKLIRVVVDIHQRIGTRPGSRTMAEVRRSLIGILVARGNHAEALEQLEVARTDMQRNPKMFKKIFHSHPAVAVALLHSDRTDEAIRMLTTAHERTLQRLGGKHKKTARWRVLLAMAQAQTGERRAALKGFQKGIPIILSRSRQSDDETTTQAAEEKRTGMVLASYIGLLADISGTTLDGEGGIDAAAEAFRLADVARGRSVQRALAASGARASVRDPELANLVRREQDSQKQTAALYSMLADALGAPTDQQDAAAVTELRTTIDNLRGARAALMEEIEQRFPDYAQLINPKPATVEEARAIMRPGEALLATYVTDERTYVWAVPKTGNVTFAAADLGGEDIADYVGLIRSSLEPQAATLGDIPDFDVESGFELYQMLLEPVEAGWKNANSLLVVAHGALGYLPFSVLPTAAAPLPGADGALFANHREVPWLVRSHAVTVLPSVASLKMLRGLPPGNAGRKAFAGFGDPFFNLEQLAQAELMKDRPADVAMMGRGIGMRGVPVRLRAAPDTGGLDSAELAQLPRLPDTRDEIGSIALALNADLTGDVFLGKRANENAVKTMDLSGYKVVAFATHGLVPGDLDGLNQPALALSAPGLSGVGGDGLLTMEEILGLKLDADWVVLSACNTGSGAGAGAEAVSGLGRAFFYAGTRAILVSNWPVETTSAKTLTTDVFRRQAGDASLSRAEALRQAMLALIDGAGYVDAKSKKTIFTYAHPIFWAPFSLIGDGGGGTAPGS